MQYLRIRATPTPAAIPRPVSLLLDSPHVEEARLVEWNPGDDRGMLGLFAVSGDVAGFEAAIEDEPELVTSEVVRTGPERFFYYAVVDLAAGPLAVSVKELAMTDGLVVLKPVVYRDGAVDARIVGEADAVGRLVELMPDVVDLEVRTVGSGETGLADPASRLSTRQREAVEAAIELGYYETPRRGTHEDVAERLGCAPSTASDHLQRAEAKLVCGAMAGHE